MEKEYGLPKLNPELKATVTSLMDAPSKLNMRKADLISYCALLLSDCIFLEEQIIQLEKVSGMQIDTLILLFRSGFTLVPHSPKFGNDLILKPDAKEILQALWTRTDTDDKEQE